MKQDRSEPGPWQSTVELMFVELEEAREAELAVVGVLQALALQGSCGGCVLEEHQGGCT